MSGQYDDIIRLPHPDSPKHPRMSLYDRAAQFSPFAALTGHSAAIAETGRLTDQRMELDEYEMAICMICASTNSTGRALPAKGGEAGLLSRYRRAYGIVRCVEVGDFRRFATAQQFASHLDWCRENAPVVISSNIPVLQKADNSHIFAKTTCRNGSRYLAGAQQKTENQ